MSEGGGAGQWEAAAVQRLRELGSGGELPLKRLLRDLVKAARKAMRQQVRDGVLCDTWTVVCFCCADAGLDLVSYCSQTMLVLWQSPQGTACVTVHSR